MRRGLARERARHREPVDAVRSTRPARGCSSSRRATSTARPTSPDSGDGSVRPRRPTPRRRRPPSSPPASSRVRLDVVVARAFQHEGPGTGRAVRRRLVGAQIAVREETGRRNSARRRPHRGARHHRRPRRGSSVRGLLDPSVPAGTYNVASGRAVAHARGARHPRVTRALPDRGRGGPGPPPGERGVRRLAAMRRSCARRRAGSLRFRSSKPWPTPWTRRGRRG